MLSMVQLKVNRWAYVHVVCNGPQRPFFFQGASNTYSNTCVPQTVHSLASSAEIDAKVIRRHLKWMKRQRERGSSGVAAQWVDRYRPDEPDALVSVG